MTNTTDLGHAKRIIKEELEEWEARGKPEWPEFDWLYDTETYLLYDEVLRLEQELHELHSMLDYKDLVQGH